MMGSCFRSKCKALVCKASVPIDTGLTPEPEGCGHRKGWLALLLVGGGSVWFEGVAQRPVRWPW